ncbi:hypothetical protein GCM10009801_00660 [Streptomyces albiaxialis]|uniref:Type A2 lantipeptide n=1 Tax=Streptomyces albiaxialis TaxID=329523 RepID=A0ABN2VDE2_9ACTN
MRDHIETAELADAELDAVSGGILNNTLGTAAGAAGTVDGLAHGAVDGTLNDVANLNVGVNAA